MDTIDRREQKSRDVIDYFYLNRDDSSEEWNQKFQPIMMEITYYDADGVEHVLESGEYIMMRTTERAIIKKENCFAVLLK